LYYRYSTDNSSWVGRGNISIIGNESNQATDATSLTINKPAGLQDGDVLFAFIVKRDNVVFSGSAGWVEDSQHLTAAGDDLSSGIYYKVVTDAAGEPASYTWTGDREEWSGGIIILRGVDNNNPIDKTTSHANGTNDATPTCPSITTSTDRAMVFACCAMTRGDVSSSTAPAGTTKQWDEYINNANGFCANFTQTTAGATGDKTWTTDGGDDDEEWHTYQVAFRVASWMQWVEMKSGIHTRLLSVLQVGCNGLMIVILIMIMRMEDGIGLLTSLMMKVTMVFIA